MNWTNGEKLIIEEKPSTISKIFSVFPMLIGFVFLFTGTGGLYSGIVELLPFSVLLILLSVVLILSFFQRNAMSRMNSATFDMHRQELEFHRDGILEGVYSLSQFKSILLLEVLKKSGKSFYTSWDVFLLHKDGAILWLDAFTSYADALFRAASLHEFTGLALEDRKDSNNSRAATRIYEDRVSGAAYNPMAISESFRDGKKVFEEVRKKSILAGITILAATLFFLGVVGFIISSLGYRNGGTDLYILGPFVLFVIIVFIFIIALNNRRATLLLDSSSLTVEIYFSLWGIQTRRTSATIPRSSIKAVRVNRLENGLHNLAVSFLPGAEPPFHGTIERFVLSMSTGLRQVSEHVHPSENPVILLETLPLAKLGQAATLTDLLYLESTIQRELQLSPDA